jgi:formylglycine-generating enzyme
MIKTSLDAMVKKLLKKKVILPFTTGIVFAVACYVAINFVMEPFSTSEYCGSECHEMNESYQSWELSMHGSNRFGIKVDCINCHLPPKEEFFTHITAKAYAGAKDLYMHKFGPEYDRQHQIEHVLGIFKSETCMHCHDSLLGKPGTSAAWEAHLTALIDPEKEENRCVTCHENVGHERQNKLHSPH